MFVDPSGVLDGRPNYANITFSRLLVGPCADCPEVIDKRPDYAAGLLLGLYVGAGCPPCVGALWRAFRQSISGEPSCKSSLESLKAKRLLRAFKQSVSGEPSFSSTFYLFLCFFGN